MKGMELPINTIIIVVLAILVLVALMVTFQNSANPGISQINTIAAYNKGCGEWKSNSCDRTKVPVVKGYNPAGCFAGDTSVECAPYLWNNEGATLLKACKGIYGGTNENDIKEECRKRCCG